MKNNIIDFNAIKKNVKISRYVFVLIAILGLTQALYNHIPSCLMINVCLLFFIILTQSPFFYRLPQRKKIILYAGIPIVMIPNYCLYLFTYYEYLQNLTSSAVIFFCCLSFILYFKVEDNFLNEFKCRIIHILLSLLFFAALYGLIYLIAFFIDNIFNLKLEYYDSVLYRFVNSISTITGTSIFILYKSKKEYTSSRFFLLMFKKLLPLILIPVLIFAAVYFIKLIFFINESTSYLELPVYYFLAVLFFIVLTMIQLCEENTKFSRIITVIAAFIPILFIAFVIKTRFVFPDREFPLPGFTVYQGYLFHEILINSLMSLYCFYILLKNKKIDTTFVYALFIASFILFFPVCGYYSFSKYNTIKAIGTLCSENKYTAFKKEYAKNRVRYLQRFDEENYEYFYLLPECSYRNNEIAECIIQAEDMRCFALGVRLRQKSKDEESFHFEGYTFTLDKLGKNLIVHSADGTHLSFDIYSKLKPYYNKDNRNHICPELLFEENKLRIQITEYTYSDKKSSYSSSDITFDIFIKK